MGEVRQEPSYLAIEYMHETEKYPVSKLCAALHVPRCSYYKWLKREENSNELLNKQIIEWIKALYVEQNGILGYRQMTIAINRTYYTAFNKKWIRRLMRALQLQSVCRKNSDRGFQYTSKLFRAKLEKAGMTQSMSRVGRYIDNGPMEGFWGILKSEMYYLRKFTDEQELIPAIESYIHFYNTGRYQKRLKCVTPMEFHVAAA